jgi:acyl-CoA synthetase (AMP-forming)/AMP-acid ligase II
MLSESGLSESLWRRDDSVPLVDHTIGSLLTARAAEYPDRLALVATAHDGGERRLTYRELRAEATRVARSLLKVAQRGGFAALWAPNLAEWPVVEYGAALAGVTLVALNPVLRPHELTYALQHSAAAVLIHADRSRDYDLAEVVAKVAGDCPELRRVISLSDWDAWLAEGDPGEGPGEPLPEVAPDAPAMLQYTSGTTGIPKGVLLRHRSLVNVAKLTMETAEAEPGSTGVNPLPMFHTAACVIGTLGPLWLGGCHVLIERFEPAAVLETIRSEQASVFFYVPAVLGALLAAAHASPNPPPALRTVMGGAAPVPRAMIEDAETTFGAAVHNLFGQTELAPVLTLTRRDDTREDLVGTVGRPMPQVECKVVDPATGRIQPLNVPGEICARGYQQLIEYLHDPEATARTVDAAGWVHTGDLGRMDGRGMITITGRLKELIIRGGENIAPAEIESCLTGHDAVLEASVVGVPDDQWGEAIGAVIRLRDGQRPGLRDELEAHCRGQLAPYKVPQRWLYVSQLPVTPTGKVQKFRLADAIRDGQLDELT